MQNNYRYVNYDLHYEGRPIFKDMKYNNGTLSLRTCYPKTIPNGTMIVSDEYLSYDLMKETMALFKLGKPLQVCATTGKWEGSPFLLKVTDDFEITKEDDRFIRDYVYGLRFEYHEK